MDARGGVGRDVTGRALAVACEAVGGNHARFQGCLCLSHFRT